MRTIYEVIEAFPKQYCPRCGGKQSRYPALSRRIDAEICSRCGNEEAVKDWKHEPDSIRTWACASFC